MVAEGVIRLSDPLPKIAAVKPVLGNQRRSLLDRSLLRHIWLQHDFKRCDMFEGCFEFTATATYTSFDRLTINETTTEDMEDIREGLEALKEEEFITLEELEQSRTWADYQKEREVKIKSPLIWYD